MTGTQALIRAGAESLPTSVYSLADCFGIKIVTYDEFTRVYDISRQELYTYASRGGFSLLTDGRFLCVLNTCLCHQPRRKWTAAHELGHILSGHIVSESSAPTPAQEKEADRFAAEVLAPLPVLHFCGVSSTAEIERLCGISRQAAEIRFAELTRLRREQEDLYRSGLRNIADFSADEIPEYTEPRSVFLRRDIDRELFVQFSPFISNYISHRAAHDGYEQYLTRSSRQPMAI